MQDRKLVKIQEGVTVPRLDGQRSTHEPRASGPASIGNPASSVTAPSWRGCAFANGQTLWDSRIQGEEAIPL